MPQVNITHTEVVYEGHVTLQKIKYTSPDKNGKPEEQTREVVSPRNAATCLMYNSGRNTVLLTRQFRLATMLNGNATGMLLETPAGLLEEGEEPSVTMMREIKEETGFEVEAVHKVLEAYTSPGSYTELVHYYIAEYKSHQQVAEGGGLEEEGEDIELVEMPFTKAMQHLEAGKIRDSKTVMLLQYAALKGLLKAQ